MRPAASASAFLALALLTSLAAAEPTAEQASQGKRAFAAGVNLLQDPDGARYEEALLQFRKAYELLDTWKVLGNEGICELKLERDGEAIASFEKYLAGGGKDVDAAERAQVERDLATLRAQVVRVWLRLPAESARVIDERVNASGAKVRNEYVAKGASLELGLHPGHHVLTAIVAGAPAMTWETDLPPGGSAEHLFVAPPPKVAAPATAPAPAAGKAEAPAGARKRPVPPTVWIAGGATVALGVGATVTGLMALSDRAAFVDANGEPGRTADELQQMRDQAATMGLVSTVLGAGAVVAGGATAWLWFTRPEAPATRGRPVVVPWMTAGGAGLAVGGAL